MYNRNKNYQSFWKTFIISPLIIATFLLFQMESKAQVNEPEKTSEVSNFEKQLKGINNAENIIINGKNIEKQILVEKYILVGDFKYHEKSKTLSILTPETSPEFYYSDLSKLVNEIRKRDKGKILKGFTYFTLSSDYNFVAMKINDYKIPNKTDTASVSDNNNSKLDDKNTIYLVDGKEVGQEQINSIKPAQIASIDVKKSVALIKAKGYDPDKVKGLMEITTKK